MTLLPVFTLTHLASSLPLGKTAFNQALIITCIMDIDMILKTFFTKNNSMTFVNHWKSFR